MMRVISNCHLPRVRVSKTGQSKAGVGLATNSGHRRPTRACTHQGIALEDGVQPGLSAWRASNHGRGQTRTAMASVFSQANGLPRLLAPFTQTGLKYPDPVTNRLNQNQNPSTARDSLQGLAGVRHG